MPLHYHLDPRQHLVIGRACGTLTDADVAAYLGAITGDARFHPTMDQLLNCLELTRVRVSYEMLHRLAHHSPFGPGSRRAIVVASTTAVTYARFYRALVQDRSSEVEVFHDMPSALRFLGRDRLTTVETTHPQQKILPTSRAIFRLA
ncbi:MAG: hypothetical protein D6781_05325 [Verrucomicrobia bacterium]|nr:MAG: hypothetical protein D6781_05325 [Verrucomicrobiota bacterium]